MSRPHPSLIALAAGRVRAGTVFSADAYNSASEHRVNGLVHHEIAAGTLEVSETLRAASGEARLVLRAQNLRLWEQYALVRDRLRAIGVETAVLKGIATDECYYPARATRPAADLDLLVAPDAFPRFGEILSTLDPDHDLVATVDELVRRDHVQSVDVRLESGLWVDLHVDAVKTGVRLRSREAMWERTIERTTVDGRQLRTLTAADALVQAVVHQLKDRFALLRGHADVARIVSSGEVDWEVVAATLRSDGLASLFWPALSIVLDDLHMHSVVSPTPRIGTISVDRVWPQESRLLGHEGMQRKVRAKHAIPFLMRGRRLEATRHYLRVLFPPRALFDHLHPGYRGPYLWKLFRMRLRFATARRRRNKRSRRLDLERTP